MSDKKYTNFYGEGNTSGLVADIIKEALAISFNKTLQISDIAGLVIKVMMIVEKMNGENGSPLSGSDKKALVVDIVKKIIEDNQKYTKETISPEVLETVPEFIDKIIEIDNGKLTISKKSCISGCSVCLVGFLKKQ